MNPDSQRRLHVRRALLNKKNGANDAELPVSL